MELKINISGQEYVVSGSPSAVADLFRIGFTVGVTQPSVVKQQSEPVFKQQIKARRQHAKQAHVK